MQWGSGHNAAKVSMHSCTEQVSGPLKQEIKVHAGGVYIYISMCVYVYIYMYMLVAKSAVTIYYKGTKWQSPIQSL